MISRLRWPALVLLVAWFLYFFGLDRTGFLSVDEPRYAWIGRAMGESGDWVSPLLYGQAWLEKPPLLYWMMGAAWQLGLRDEWAARLPVASVSVAFLALFWWALRRRFDAAIARASTGILATCGGWLLYSYVAVTDIPLAATFGAAMMLAWSGHLRWAGVCLGLAVLAKALVPLALALPLLWWFRTRWRELVVPILLAFAVAAPWYALAFARHGRALFDELIVRHHFARFFDATAQVLHPQPFWFYLPVILLLMLPWTPLALAARPHRLWSDERSRFFVVWLGFGLLMFSLSAGKLPGYLLPVLPAAAVLLGISMVEAARSRLWLAVVAAIAGALFAAPSEKLLEGIVASSGGPVVTNLGWVGLAVGLLVGAFWSGKCTFRTIVMVVLLMGGLRHWAAGIADRHTARPFRDLSTQVCAAPGLHRAWLYGLSYYAHAPIPACTPAGSLKRWQASNSDSGLYLSDSEAGAGQ